MSEQLRPSRRSLTVGINVGDVRRLPQVGRHLAAFLKTVDHDHGPFDINLAVSVEPTVAGAIGPVEFPNSSDDLAPQIEVIYVDGGEDFTLPEGAD